MVDEPPSDLQEQQADGELHAADERAREGASGEVDEPEPTRDEEDPAHQERPRRDLVLTEPLRNCDRAECLQRRDGPRQPVDERDGDVEQSGREQNGGRREPVLDDQGDRDRNQNAQIRDRPRKLVPAEAHGESLAAEAFRLLEISEDEAVVTWSEERSPW